MHIKKVKKTIKITKQSLEEVREDNRAYFEHLAERVGPEVAKDMEKRYMEEVARELAELPGEEELEVTLIDLESENTDSSENRL